MTHRIEQTESTLRKALAQVLQRKISDPRIRGLVSIMAVDISPDLKKAKVMVSVMPEQFEKVTLAGLRAADRHIGAEVKKLVAMRVVPHLDFVLDKSIKTSDVVLDAIGQAMDRTGPEDPEHEDHAQDASGPDSETQPRPRESPQDV